MDMTLKSAIFASQQEASDASNDRMPLADEEKISKKGFFALEPSTQCQLLLISSNGITIPTKPTARFQTLLIQKNGAMASNLFQKWLIKLDLSIFRGMAHNISNGNVLSSDPHTVDNFAPHFLAPKSCTSIKLVSQNDMFRWDLLNSNNALSKEDTSDILENKIFIPTSKDHLIRVISNTEVICAIIFTPEAVLCVRIRDFLEALDQISMTLQIYIDSVPYFSVSLLQQLHFRMQKFFGHCLKDIQDVSEIKYDIIDFSDLATQIEMQTYVPAVPMWYKKL